jgi:hypothetical protein
MAFKFPSFLVQAAIDIGVAGISFDVSGASSGHGSDLVRVDMASFLRIHRGH